MNCSGGVQSISTVERNLIGAEDLGLGTGVMSQSRNGRTVQVTRINAANFPYDGNRTLAQAFQDEKARAFASLHVDSSGYLIATYAEEGLFSLDSDGYLLLDYSGVTNANN